MEHFFILTSQRTGSNHLVALLDSHPHVRCFGEIFRPHYNVRRRLPHVDSTFCSITARKRAWFSYLHQIRRGLNSDDTLWGFKLMVGQHPCVSSLIASWSDKMIVLYRDNVLAKYSSELLAKKTGQGVAGRNARIIRDVVTFSEAQFLRYATNEKRKLRQTYEAVVQSDCPVFFVEYTDLTIPETAYHLQKFLGLELSELRSGHKKRNSSEILQRFDNPDTVRRFLEREGQTGLLYEEASIQVPRGFETFVSSERLRRRLNGRF